MKAQKPVSPAYPLELKTIGDHIRKRRLDLNLTQVELAEKFQTCEGAIVYWEKNHKSPSLKFIPQIIQFLGYNPYENISSASLGERIIAYRRDRGITQEEFAHQLGVDQGTLMRWEKGRRIPWKEMQDILDRLLHPRV